ncbi:MAG: hypothetical protein ABSD88_10495 [Candidatus Korobacteraceae bacterium]|jgi:O-antigen/teichoic acid export membrane protein
MSARQQAAVGPGERGVNFDRFFNFRPQQKLLTGSVIMLAGSGFVSLANFGYNLAAAHLLGPGDFGHAAAAVTLLMLASCINLAFQLVTAKFIARNQEGGRAGVYRSLRNRAWSVGLALSFALLVLSGSISSYLRLPSPHIIEVLALGMLFYIPLGVRRGWLQGTCRFFRLSLSLSVEAAVKLAGAFVFIMFMHAGVMGAVGAITLSVCVAYFMPCGDGALRDESGLAQPASFSEGIQAIIFFIGQVIINNVDILMVKHYFAPGDAGLYAAVALVGRLLYFATWMVTSAMFPVSAGARVEKESRKTVIVPLCFIVGLSIIFVSGLAAFPELIIRVLFGGGFHHEGLQLLLIMNAVATGTYALSVVLITYEMSRRIASTAWLQLAVSGLLMGGVVAFHASLLEVIIVQQVLRAALLIAVSIPFLARTKPAIAEAA